MGHSKIARSACLMIAGVATAWVGAEPAARASSPENVDVTATSTQSGALTNPYFIFVSNTSIDPPFSAGPAPGEVALPAANFGAGANAQHAFSFIGDDDGFFIPNVVDFPGSMGYTIAGVSPAGNLVLGVRSDVAAAVISSPTAFDTLFPPAGTEAALIAALLGNNNAGLDAFALQMTSSDGLVPNPNIPQYSFFNGALDDPKLDTITLIEFKHDGNTPVNTQFGTVDMSLLTEVPEPASLSVLGIATAAMLLRRRRAN